MRCLFISFKVCNCTEYDQIGGVFFNQQAIFNAHNNVTAGNICTEVHLALLVFKLNLNNQLNPSVYVM